MPLYSRAVLAAMWCSVGEGEGLLHWERLDSGARLLSYFEGFSLFLARSD